MSEFRYCKLKDRWTIIAPERAKRPGLPDSISELTPTDSPFAYGNESLTPPEIYAIRDGGSKPNTPDWKVRVVPNKYRALNIETEPRPHLEGFFENFAGFGAHEVIIDQPDPSKRPHSYSQEEWRLLLFTMKERINNLNVDPRLSYIQIFKNEGKSAGATIDHPHTQLVALPFIPRDIQDEIETARQHYQEHHRSLILDEVHEELRQNIRVLFENRSFAIYCPYASAFPFEIRISPKYVMEDFSQASEPVLVELAEALKFVSSKLEKAMPNMPYNLILRTSPLLRDHPEPNYFYHMDRFYQWRIELLPRLYNLAGFELATGYMINPVSPEEAASFLKDDN